METDSGGTPDSELPPGTPTLNLPSIHPLKVVLPFMVARRVCIVLRINSMLDHHIGLLGLL